MPPKRKNKSPAAQRPAMGVLMTAVIIAAIVSDASKPGRKSDPKTLDAVELVSQYFELMVIIIIIPCTLSLQEGKRAVLVGQDRGRAPYSQVPRPQEGAAGGGRGRASFSEA